MRIAILLVLLFKEKINKVDRGSGWAVRRKRARPGWKVMRGYWVSWRGNSDVDHQRSGRFRERRLDRRKLRDAQQGRVEGPSGGTSSLLGLFDAGHLIAPILHRALSIPTRQMAPMTKAWRATSHINKSSPLELIRRRPGCAGSRVQWRSQRFNVGRGNVRDHGCDLLKVKRPCSLTKRSASYALNIIIAILLIIMIIPAAIVIIAVIIAIIIVIGIVVIVTTTFTTAFTMPSPSPSSSPSPAPSPSPPPWPPP